MEELTSLLTDELEELTIFCNPSGSEVNVATVFLSLALCFVGVDRLPPSGWKRLCVRVIFCSLASQVPPSGWQRLCVRELYHRKVVN